LKSNATKILCCFAIFGVIGTAVSTYFATKKSVKKIDGEGHDLENKQKVKLVAKYYIPSVVIASGAIGCIICSEKINARSIAAASATIALLKKSYDKYGKAVEKAFGIDGVNIVRNELVKMGENKTEPIPSEDRDVYWIGYGYDDYFLSTPEEIELAEAELNKRLHKGMAVSVADFMDMLNLSPSSESIAMGWSRLELAREDDEWIDLILNTIDSDGDHPAQEIEFSSHPTTEFEEHSKWFREGIPVDRTMPFDDEPPFDLV